MLAVGRLVDEHRIETKVVIALLLVGACLLGGKEDGAAIGRPSIVVDPALMPGELTRFAAGHRQAEHLSLVVDLAKERQAASIRREAEGATTLVANEEACLTARKRHHEVVCAALVRPPIQLGGRVEHLRTVGGDQHIAEAH